MAVAEAAPRMRLLAVDDHPDSGELVVRMAKRSGYDAVATADPKQVGSLVRELKPDVLTMDLCMPEIDAIELFAVLKQVGFAGHLVIVSGQDDALRRAAAKLAGFHGIRVVDDLQKPVDLSALRHLLTSLQSCAH